MAYDQVHDVRPQFSLPRLLAQVSFFSQLLMPTRAQETNLRRFTAGAISGMCVR
jgi:hypothetical protein